MKIHQNLISQSRTTDKASGFVANDNSFEVSFVDSDTLGKFFKICLARNTLQLTSAINFHLSTSAIILDIRDMIRFTHIMILYSYLIPI